MSNMNEEHESAHTAALLNAIRMYEKEGESHYLESAKKALDREIANSTLD